VAVAATSRVILQWFYDGAQYNLYGDPTPTTGTGTTFALQTSASLNAPTVTGSLYVSGSIYDINGNVRNIPQNLQTSIYTMSKSDVGGHVYTNNTVLISASVFSTNDVFTIVNQTGSSIGISGSGITLRQTGTANTGSRTLASYGWATVLCVSSSLFFIAGSGLS
jgi:hypothetical protein